MKVAEYLKRFLTEQPGQEAAVPGLGVFYAGEKDGRRCILFKEEMPTSKAFLNFLSFEENISEEQARQEVEKWVRHLLQELKASGSVDMEGIGTFAIMGDKVEYSPAFREKAAADADFGLEKTLPAEPASGMPDGREASPAARPETVRKPEPARGQEGERFRSRNTMRPRQAQPLEKPKLKPVPNPGGSGKELVLEKSRNARKAKSPASGAPFYTSWWFIVLCAVVVVLVLLFAITPVRERMLGTSGASARMEMPGVSDSLRDAELEQSLDAMIAAQQEEEIASEAAMTDREKTVAEENAIVASKVIAGQARKHEADQEAKAAAKKEAPARKAVSAKASTKTRPVSPAKTRKAASPAQARENSASGVFPVEQPQSGRFYIIVGSFVSDGNAQGKARQLTRAGYQPSILYIEAKSYYYVSVKTCQSREEAVAARTELRGKNVECWIFAN